MAQVSKKPPLIPASISPRLVGKLLVEKSKLPTTSIRKHPTVLHVTTTLAQTNFLIAIALSRYIVRNSIRLVPIYPESIFAGYGNYTESDEMTTRKTRDHMDKQPDIHVKGKRHNK
ncbi:hypothetical protein BB561_002841 [Smittium simulii]|uniref:Uncharacterized protein n=1 Tax=Smittium simulii TaxID=133385 RepID=A0A2T9YNW4_9FUNG|nr:hypothetical protein BB561_002841 [Smittium simulii]